MSISFTRNEWAYMFQLVYQINEAEDYSKFAKKLLEQIRPLIPFSKGKLAKLRRNGTKCELFDDVCLNPSGVTQDETVFRKYASQNAWSMYGFHPWCSVIRTSELPDLNKEGSVSYKNIWAAQNIRYGLLIFLIYNNEPCGVVGLFRPKSEADFTDYEVSVAENLMEHFSLRLHQILCFSRQAEKAQHAVPLFNDKIQEYSITKREGEVLKALLQGQETKEICQALCIEKATLRRHTHNIYQKTGVTSRVQLIKLFEK